MKLAILKRSGVAGVSSVVQAGSQRLSQAIDMTDPDHFSSEAVSEFFDVDGHKYREGCATAVGQRFD